MDLICIKYKLLSHICLDTHFSSWMICCKRNISSMSTNFRKTLKKLRKNIFKLYKDIPVV